MGGVTGVLRLHTCKYESIIDGSVRLGAYSNAPIPLICDNWRHEARDGLVVDFLACFGFHNLIILDTL